MSVPAPKWQTVPPDATDPSRYSQDKPVTYPTNPCFPYSNNQRQATMPESMLPAFMYYLTHQDIAQEAFPWLSLPNNQLRYLSKVTDIYSVPRCLGPPFNHTRLKSIICRLWTPKLRLCLIYLCLPEPRTICACKKKVPDNLDSSELNLNTRQIC